MLVVRLSVYPGSGFKQYISKILSSKWVFTIKKGLNGEIVKYKARIVAGGHRQRKGIDFKETFAPVAKFASLRILLILVANEDWEGEQGDIVTTFRIQLNILLNSFKYFDSIDYYTTMGLFGHWVPVETKAKPAVPYVCKISSLGLCA